MSALHGKVFLNFLYYTVVTKRTPFTILVDVARPLTESSVARVRIQVCPLQSIHKPSGGNDSHYKAGGTLKYSIGDPCSLARYESEDTKKFMSCLNVELRA